MKIAALVACVTLAASCRGAAVSVASSTVAPSGDAVPVVKVIDGDTIRVRIGGAEEKVRLIGIDTPEVDSHDCYATEATEELKRLLGHDAVRLEKERSERDRYGRLLRDIYTPDGRFVNAELVRSGHARALRITPDVAHAKELASLEADARAARRGLWGACAGG